MPVQAEQSDVLESPTADFFAFFTSGNAPHTTEFMDKSTGNPTDWYWDFGDGATSSQRDPVHKYSEPGKYTVTLTVSNDAGSDEKTRTDYIVVKEAETNTAEKTVAKSSSSSKESTKDTKISASKSVSLSYLQVAAKTDPARSQGKTTPGATDSVEIVEAALAEEGLLDEKYAYDGNYGTATIKGYKKWQESIGSAEKYCDGIPGKKDLTKLGNKYGFTVDTSTPSDFYLYQPKKETTKDAGSRTNTEEKPTHTYSETREYTSQSELSKVNVPAKAYPEPGVRVVSAKLDSTGKYIEVDYYLKSDFYSDSRTRTYFSIGYKFVDERLNTIYNSNKFVDINQPKGHYVAKIPYVGVPAHINIYTRYKVGNGNSQLGGGIQYENKKMEIFAAPIGEKNTTKYVVTKEDVKINAGIGLLSGAPKIGASIGSFGLFKSIDAMFEFNTMPPDPWVGQVIEATGWYEDGKRCLNVKVWPDEEAYKERRHLIYDETSRVKIF